VELLEHKLGLFENRVNNELIQNREDRSQSTNNDGEIVKNNDAKLENPATYSYDIAIIEFKKNNLQGAQELFKKFIDKYPKSNLISNGYFWYAETFYKQNKFDLAAINYFKGYHAAPKGAKALDSLLQGAASLGHLKKSKEACSILDKISKEFPNKSTSAAKRIKELKDKFGCGGKK
jgi:tol-pal system protein YbgF